MNPLTQRGVLRGRSTHGCAPPPFKTSPRREASGLHTTSPSSRGNFYPSPWPRQGERSRRFGCRNSVIRPLRQLDISSRQVDGWPRCPTRYRRVTRRPRSEGYETLSNGDCSRAVAAAVREEHHRARPSTGATSRSAPSASRANGHLRDLLAGNRSFNLLMLEMGSNVFTFTVRPGPVCRSSRERRPPCECRSLILRHLHVLRCLGFPQGKRADNYRAPGG
jgi:hypothetical protein